MALTVKADGTSAYGDEYGKDVVIHLAVSDGLNVDNGFSIHGRIERDRTQSWYLQRHGRIGGERIGLAYPSPKAALDDLYHRLDVVFVVRGA